MKYSIIKGVVKALKGIVLFAIPVLVNAFIVEYPAIAQLSAGGLLLLIVNYLKVKNVPVARI